MKTNKLWSIMMMLILVLGTAIALSSCSKDDDNIGDGGNNTTLLVGRWYFYPREDYEDSGIEFYKNGSTYHYNWWGTGKGSYVYNKNNATLTIRSPHRTETYYNVQITKRDLTFTDGVGYTYFLSR